MVTRGDPAFTTAVNHALSLADDFSRRLGAQIRTRVATFPSIVAATRSRVMLHIDQILDRAFGLTQRAALLSDLYLTILTATDSAAARPFASLFTRIESTVTKRGNGLWDRVRTGLHLAPDSDSLANAYRATTARDASRTAYLRDGKLNANRRWVKGDGTIYRLSDRVWKQGRRIRRLIDRILRNGIRNENTPDDIGKEIERAIVPGATPSASSMARTLARTETARVYHEAEKQVATIAPDVIGLRWKLGQAHGLDDVCDGYADADDYELGPGGYPPGDVPEVPHANCNCHRDMIFATNVDLADTMIDRYGGE